MCNAWNHHPDCTCGWGGEGHLGGRSDNFYGNVLSSSQFDTRDSFSNPNAQCPVCGKDVFFYQNINGSKVYFDHLGHPWPKHPCTNNENEFKGESFSYSEPSGHTLELNNNTTEAWIPIARASLKEVRRGLLKLEAIGAITTYVINCEKVKNSNKYALRNCTPKHMTAPDFIFYRTYNSLEICEIDFYSIDTGSHLECGVKTLKFALEVVAGIRNGTFGVEREKPPLDRDAIIQKISPRPKAINNREGPENSKKMQRKIFDRKVKAILQLGNSALADYIKKEDKNSSLYKIAMNEIMRRYRGAGRP